MKSMKIGRGWIDHLDRQKNKTAAPRPFSGKREKSWKRFRNVIGLDLSSIIGKASREKNAKDLEQDPEGGWIRSYSQAGWEDAGASRSSAYFLNTVLRSTGYSLGSFPGILPERL
jgi:hypothetical protein